MAVWKVMFTKPSVDSYTEHRALFTADLSVGNQ